jgi:thiamine pyrophosphate-dependent acetolactate synthase large subunit-like protein
MKRIEALRAVVDVTAELPVVATCAATSRELAAVADRPNHLYLLDSMGLTTSVGTGLALAIEDSAVERVIVLDGDGSLLMNLNALATAAFLRLPRLVVVCLDNASYASTAGLATYASDLDLGAIAAGTGLNVLRADDPPSLLAALDEARSQVGPHFVHVRIQPGNAADIPLLLMDPAVLGDRFRRWLAAAMREAVQP